MDRIKVSKLTMSQIQDLLEQLLDRLELHVVEDYHRDDIKLVSDATGK